MDTVPHQLADLILAIEAEMRHIGLWEQKRPDAQALESLVPFCNDTLTFEQWMQWVFLQKMKAVIESGEDFPATSDIHLPAEHRFSQLPQNTDKLLNLIYKFDEFINQCT